MKLQNSQGHVWAGGQQVGNVKCLGPGQWLVEVLGFPKVATFSEKPEKVFC